MAPRQDWNLKMVCERQTRRHLPKLGGSAELIDWGDIQVGHLDTGYTEHEVFGDWTNGAVWLRVDAGLNLREPKQKPLDPLNYEGNPGHGTRTCSVLCGVASDPNFDSEIGVAPRLPVVPCRIVNRVVLTPEIQRKRVAAGIRHALAQNCAVVSVSLGIPTFWETGGMGRAVDEAYEAGLILVGAGGQVIDRVTYPGKYKRTIGVGGVTRQRRIWHRYESTWPIDVWAPATDVLRANSRPEGSLQAFDALQTEGDDPGSSVLSSGSSGDSFGTGAGTSYATVHVAAAAAMWLRAPATPENRISPSSSARLGFWPEDSCRAECASVAAGCCCTWRARQVSASAPDHHEPATADPDSHDRTAAAPAAALSDSSYQATWPLVAG